MRRWGWGLLAWRRGAGPSRASRPKVAGSGVVVRGQEGRDDPAELRRLFQVRAVARAGEDVLADHLEQGRRILAAASPASSPEASVNADFDHLRWFDLPASSLRGAAAIRPGLCSRMHRQCPSGHTRGPCLWHGRHSRPATPAVALAGASGPNPNAGTVGPNTASVGVPTAEARCCGAESLVTRTRARRISSALASSDSRPVASTARPGAQAATTAAAG